MPPILPYIHESSSSEDEAATDHSDGFLWTSPFNPFDDSTSSEEFHDTHESEQQQQQQEVGPLEAALLEYSDWDGDHIPPDRFEVRSDVTSQHPSRKNSTIRNNNHSHLSSNGSDVHPMPMIKRRQSQSRWLNIQTQAPPVSLESPVLSKLESNPLETTASTPWIKLILLEELGTASSWIVLLLPYIAFILCLLLDPYSLVTRVGPLNATSYCQNTTATPLFQTMPTSCTHSFSLPSDLLRSTPRYQYLMHQGTAFASSPFSGVPPMASFLRGDAQFKNLTTPMVALVAQGMVVTSTVVMQQNGQHDWVPLSVGAPERLSMVCLLAEDLPLSANSMWDCTSPRIADVLFSMPGTGVLSGRPLQLNVLYAFHKVPEGTLPPVYAEGAEYLLWNYVVQTADAPALVDTMVLHSTYTIEHESAAHETVNIMVRLVTWVLTMLFLARWCQRMGVKGFFGLSDRACCWRPFRVGHHEEEEPLNKHKAKSKSTFWWESPWILFPERRYLLLLMMTLMLDQNPLLIYAFFHPELYSSPNFHTLVDAMLGIGIHLNFMLWLCIIQGLRYHTAAVNRRRARQQRQVLEFRRTAKYIAQAEATFTETEEDFIERYTREYFETYGDVDGTGSSETLDVRLKNDPCGDSWADFLLSKCVLLVIGVTSVIVCSAYRFSANEVIIAPQVLARYNAIYICSSFVELFMIFIWVCLMFRHAFRTGEKLRREPFLSTRPAQLAYRILLGILVLTFGSSFVPIVADVYHFFSKWRIHGHDQVLGQDSTSSAIDILLKVVLHISQRIPYGGATAFYGPGKVLFGTVNTLLAAFIFLPSRSFADPEDPWLNSRSEDKNTDPIDSVFSNLYLADFGRRNKDKRQLVKLARYTHTWRILPLPIKRVSSITSNLLSNLSFQLEPADSSIAFFGRYTAVFCLEIACWLLEASWQAYYSPNDFSSDSFAPGRMALDSIGLRLEKAIFDEETLTRAFISTNINAQVDGPEDSIIVVAFRGTANVQNMRMDLKLRQIPLLDQVIGLGEPMFQVHADGIDASRTNSWFYDTPSKHPSKLKSYTPNEESRGGGCISFPSFTQKPNAVAAVSLGAKAVLKATPVTRQALPCVHQGFQEAYSHMREEVWSALLGILQRQLAKSVERTRGDHEYGRKEPLYLPKIYVTGHSLGGSIAQLLALDVANNCELNLKLEDPVGDQHNSDDGFFHIPMDTPTKYGPETLYSPIRTTSSGGLETRETIKLKPALCVYTYGQPRVGNHAFARIYKKAVPHTFRVATEGDAITSTPTAMMCGGWYKHAGLEVMLDEGLTGNILVGPTVVETMFRFTKMRTSLAAHSLETYRDALESGLTQDELQEYYRTHGIARTKASQKRGQNQPIQQNLPEWLTTVKKRQKSIDN